MNKKISVWQKVNKYIYKQIACSDQSMEVLDIFLNDELGFQTYIDFLKNDKVEKFTANVSTLNKVGRVAIIQLDDYVYPGMNFCRLSTHNLILILEEYKKLFLLEADRIELVIDENDQVTITGE